MSTLAPTNTLTALNVPKAATVPTLEQPGIQPMQAVGAPPASPTSNPQVTPPAVIPPPPPPTTQPPIPGGQQFGAGSNLLSTQINPSAPTASAPNTNFGTGAVTAGPAFNPTDSDRFANYSGRLDGAVNELTTGPNRTAMAMTALQDFDTAGQPQLEAGYRRVGQLASKFGRIGSGMTTNDLTGLSATYQRDRGLMARGLARDVAEGDINDRFRRVDSLNGLRLGEEGIQSNRRGEMRTDRGYNTGVDQWNQGALFDRQRAGNDYTSDYEDRLYNQNRAGANDLRGERDYQTNRSDKAQEDQIRQRTMEESLLNSSFGRASDRLNAGSSGNPAGAYESFANRMGSDASDLMGAGAGLLTQGSTKRPEIDYEQLIQALLSQRGG